MAAGDLAAQALGFLNREQRLMADGRVGDAEAVEGGKQLVRRHGHGKSGGRGGRRANFA